MRNRRRGATCLLIAIVAVAAVWKPGSLEAQANGEAKNLKLRVPAADPAKYRDVRDVRNWRNPWLTVQAKGIDIRPIRGAAPAATMSPAQTISYLEKLLASAWPYGLVVVVTESGVIGVDDGPIIKKNLRELVSLLEKAGVKVDLWPSA